MDSLPPIGSVTEVKISAALAAQGISTHIGTPAAAVATSAPPWTGRAARAADP